jgi:hypothetical protein
VYRAIAYYLENQAEVKELIAANKVVMKQLEAKAGSGPTLDELRRRAAVRQRTAAIGLLLSLGLSGCYGPCSTPIVLMPLGWITNEGGKSENDQAKSGVDTKAWFEARAGNVNSGDDLRTR